MDTNWKFLLNTKYKDLELTKGESYKAWVSYKAYIVYEGSTYYIRVLHTPETDPLCMRSYRINKKITLGNTDKWYRIDILKKSDNPDEGYKATGQSMFMGEIDE